MNKIALRIDDIGASTKKFNYYSKNRFCNFGILRHRKLFGAWAPYGEISAAKWSQIFEILKEFDAKLTVAVTACWVDKNGNLEPFNEKFPEQAHVLKSGVKGGFIEIANHGLTHCVTEGKSYKPKLIGSVRKFHREFWDWLDDDIHFQNLYKSQDILQNFFEEKINVFVPPGNVYSRKTVEAANSVGINLINCNTTNDHILGVRIIDNKNVIDFHDREIFLYGVDWLRNCLEANKDYNYCFVSEI